MFNGALENLNWSIGLINSENLAIVKFRPVTPSSIIIKLECSQIDKRIRLKKLIFTL